MGLFCLHAVRLGGGTLVRFCSFNSLIFSLAALAACPVCLAGLQHSSVHPACHSGPLVCSSRLQPSVTAAGLLWCASSKAFQQPPHHIFCLHVRHMCISTSDTCASMILHTQRLSCVVLWKHLLAFFLRCKCAWVHVRFWFSVST